MANIRKWKRIFEFSEHYSELEGKLVMILPGRDSDSGSLVYERFHPSTLDGYCRAQQLKGWLIIVFFGEYRRGLFSLA